MFFEIFISSTMDEGPDLGDNKSMSTQWRTKGPFKYRTRGSFKSIIYALLVFGVVVGILYAMFR